MEKLIYGAMELFSTLAVWWRRLSGFIGVVGFTVFAGVGFLFFRLLKWHSGMPRAYELMFRKDPASREAVAKDLERALEKLRKPPVK